MKYAIFSDIHSNLEALETAVSCVKGRGIQKIAVLGDTVGYGANPNECLEWVVQNADVRLMGNHEKGVIDPGIRDWFNDYAREALVWTDEVLDEKFRKSIAGLPFMRLEKGATFVHSSPDRPEEFKYLLSYEDAQSSFRSMEGDICFVGHTHVPCSICANARRAEYLRPGILKLAAGERYILNPGSVGQPRDRDPRLAFGIFDDSEQTFEIVRLDYDNRKAADKIRKAGLPQYLADRLL